MYEILKKNNDWLNNYKGQTFTDRLQHNIIKGVMQEHAKFKSGSEIFMEQLYKKSLVACIEKDSNEILSIGASSLLKDDITGKIIDNLILDNFGQSFSAII